MWALDRQKGSPILFETERVISVAEQIFDEDVALCDSIANHGATLVQDGENLLTHCNAGALATAGIGTAVGIIRRAHELGKKIHVFVDETRPLLQGGRLTAWELRKAGIPFTLICDNMAAGLMHAGRIQRVFVGADRIATNGDFANKIGTYGVAVLANHHKIPFHPAAPYSTVDFDCSSGKHIPIEQRAGEEVRGAAGSFGKVRWAPAGCDTYNPSFDVTPVELVTALVLDNGVFNRDELKNGALNKLKGNL
jgi:methylthioribose-1-phosphate isomerase